MPRLYVRVGVLKWHWHILLGIIVVAAVVWGLVVLDVRAILSQVLEWVNDLGMWAPVVFGLIYILVTVLVLPGSILTMGAGVVFGILEGVIIMSISSTLAATLAFLISRYFAREWVAGKISDNPKFRALDDAVGEEGWKIVLLMRFSPLFPFNLMNYVFGVSRVRFKEYFFATWLGMLPGTLLFVYMGSVAGSLAALDGTARERTPADWALYGFGFMATAAATLYVGRLARRALRQKHIPA